MRRGCHREVVNSVYGAKWVFRDEQSNEGVQNVRGKVADNPQWNTDCTKFRTVVTPENVEG